jgi:hypothetical protein
VNLWDREVELLRSIKNHRRTAIKACHASGKTFTLAVAALWWVTRHREGIVLTTSPTQRQVRTQLWSEIHRLVGNAKVPFPPLKMTEFKFRGEDNFAIGFSTNQTEHFQGYHGKSVLIIADEAPGIESGIWDAIAGTMAGGKVHIVMAGNPTVPSGAFFDAFSQERGLWNPISISAFDSPNLAGLDLEHLLKLDPVEGGPLDDNKSPFLVTKRWVYEQYWSWWHGSESSSPNWLSRVLARFPDQAEDALIKINWLEKARQRASQNPVQDNGSRQLVVGIDVGAGSAETVAYICEVRRDRRRIIAMGAWRGDDTRGQVVKFLNQFRSRISLVRVDAIGVGHNFGLHLQDCGFPVKRVNVGLPCESQPHLGDSDPALRFVNLKACFYQTLADAFERDQVEGLTDEVTFGQLAGIRYELDSHGKIRIESKEKARQRGIASPDRADALMLALAEPLESWSHPWIQQNSAVRRFQSGRTIESIAEELEATPDEVRAWLRDAARSGIFRSSGLKLCNRCGECIGFNNVEYNGSGDNHWHVRCPKISSPPLHR